MRKLLFSFACAACCLGAVAQPQTVAPPLEADALVRWGGDASALYQQGATLHFGGTRVARLAAPPLQMLVAADQVAALVPSSGKTTDVNLHVFAADGTPRYTATLPHQPDDHRPMVALHATGAATYGYAATTELVFLTADGTQLRNHRLFPEAPHELERSLRIAADPAGAFVAVAAMREAAHPEGRPGNVTLFVFDADGTLRWQQAVPEQSLGALAVSPDGRYLGLATYDAFAANGFLWQTRVFDLDGQQVLQAAEPAEALRFAADAILLTTKKQAVRYDLTTGTPVFRYRPPAGVQLVDAQLHPADGEALMLTGQYAFADGRFVLEQPALVSLDAAGAIRAEAVLNAPPSRSARLLALPDGVAAVLDAHAFTLPWTLRR